MKWSLGSSLSRSVPDLRGERESLSRGDCNCGSLNSLLRGRTREAHGDQPWPSPRVCHLDLLIVPPDGTGWAQPREAGRKLSTKMLPSGSLTSKVTPGLDCTACREVIQLFIESVLCRKPKWLFVRPRGKEVTFFGLTRVPGSRNEACDQLSLGCAKANPAPLPSHFWPPIQIFCPQIKGVFLAKDGNCFWAAAGKCFPP